MLEFLSAAEIGAIN